MFERGILGAEVYKPIDALAELERWITGVEGTLDSARDEHAKLAMARNIAIHRKEPAEKLLDVVVASDGVLFDNLDIAFAELTDTAARARQIRKEAIDQLSTLALEVLRMGDRLRAIEGRKVEHLQNDPSVRRRVWEMTDGKCIYCSTPLYAPGETDVVLAPDIPQKPFHVDHIVPKDAGGPDHICNYVPACQTCNISKSNKPFAEFVTKREVKLRVVGASE